MEHLLSAWPQVVEQLKGATRILLLADFDGTLTPIVAMPELAVMPELTKQLLQQLAGERRITVGIISGRALSDLKRRAQVAGIIYAGNHGLEIEGPGVSFTNPFAEEAKPLLRIVRHVLNLAFRGITGVFVEDKGLSLSVHYRQVEDGKTREVKSAFDRVIDGLQNLGKVRVTHGKKVYEVRPAVDWDKGKAIRLLMKKYGKGGRLSGLLPVYLGDDLTDEDGFNAIERYGNGLTVFVGDASHPSSARFFLQSPEEVAIFLVMLLDLSRGEFK